MDEPASAVGRYGLPSWMRAALPLVAVAAWLGTAAGYSHTFLVPGYLSIIAGINLALPPTLVNRDAVRISSRRYRFRRVIRWDDVTAVIVSGPHEADDRVRLRLSDGKLVILPQVPRSRGSALAELARTALTRGFAPPPPPPPAPIRYPTPAQQDQDLTVRAKHLAQQNRDCAKPWKASARQRHPAAILASRSTCTPHQEPRLAHVADPLLQAPAPTLPADPGFASPRTDTDGVKA